MKKQHDSFIIGIPCDFFLYKGEEKKISIFINGFSIE